MGLLLSYISSLSIVIPLVFGFIFFRNLSLSYRVLTMLVLVGALTEASLYLFFDDKTFSILNAYTVLEFSFIAFFFIKSLERKRDQQITYTLLTLFILLNFYLFVISDNKNTINSIGLVTESLFVLVISLLFFFQIVNEQVDQLFKSPDVWFIIGLLLYFGGNFFTFGYSSSFLMESTNFPFDLWITHSIFNIIFNSCIAISLVLAGNKA